MTPSLWHLLQLPKRNKTACDSGRQCLILRAINISKQRKGMEAGREATLTGVIGEVFILGGTGMKYYLQRILYVHFQRD